MDKDEEEAEETKTLTMAKLKCTTIIEPLSPRRNRTSEIVGLGHGTCRGHARRRDGRR
jgi:hypothetical protein